MYKLDRDNPYEMTAVNPETGKEITLDVSGEALLEHIGKSLESKITGKGIIAKALKGTIHISCYLIESDMRRRRFLRGEENPKERRFKL